MGSMRGNMDRVLSIWHARPKKCIVPDDIRTDEIGSSLVSRSKEDRRTSTSSTSSNVSTDSSCSSLFSYVNMNMSADTLQELAQQELQAEKFRTMIARRRSTGTEERILKHYEKCLADTEERIETLRLSAFPL